MHSAIVYAVMPSDAYKARDKAAFLLADLVPLSTNKSVARLGDYVWQINFRESPGALARLVHACEQHAVPYRILPLADAPQWIEGDPTAK